MMVEKEHELTQEGYDSLMKKLDFYRTQRRREVAERIRQAKEFGEIGENAEYEDAKSEQAFVEGEIIQLENILRYARIISKAEVHTDQVSIGTIVRLKDLESGEETEYKIVGTNESDPEQGKISNESPLGQVLVGCKKGATVELKVPAGSFKYKIQKIAKLQ
jgi:transcription elongation factor GreA